MLSPLHRSANEKLLSGWGGTASSCAQVRTVLSVEDIQDAVVESTPRGVLARGMGRSYGDAAQAAGGTVLDLSALTKVELDRHRGLVTVGSGLTLDRLLRLLVPAGFFVPMTPGTRMISMGGAVGCDVHGKSHHREGTFGSHVRSMTVVDGLGQIRVLTPESTPSEFWATVGGMGLTSVVTELTFDVQPIETSLMSVDTERVDDIDDLMSRMSATDDAYRYSVAWIDSLSPSGRGILLRGNHATLAELSPVAANDPLAYNPRSVGRIPVYVPAKTLNMLTVRAFNEAWFRRAPRLRRGELQSIAPFFHPLDRVQGWNQVYGTGGFLQYQFVVPDADADIVSRAFRRLREIGAPSFLTAIKRFGAANPAPLSFPQPGWTLAVDVPARVAGLAAVLNELDDAVLAAGGRLYLAKDSRMSAEMMAASYPRLDEWRKVREQMDPHRHFTSDLARRLLL